MNKTENLKYQREENGLTMMIEIRMMTTKIIAMMT